MATDKLAPIKSLAAARLAAAYSLPQATAQLWVAELAQEAGGRPAGALLELVRQIGPANPERRQLGRFLLAAWGVFGDEPFLANQLVHAPVRRPELDEIVAQIAPPAGGDKTRVHQLGRWLSANAGISIDGYHLEAAGDRNGSTLWAVCAVE